MGARSWRQSEPASRVRSTDTTWNAVREAIARGLTGVRGTARAVRSAQDVAPAGEADDFMAACFRLDREGARQMAAAHPEQLKRRRAAVESGRIRSGRRRRAAARPRHVARRRGSPSARARCMLPGMRLGASRPTPDRARRRDRPTGRHARHDTDLLGNVRAAPSRRGSAHSAEPRRLDARARRQAGSTAGSGDGRTEAARQRRGREARRCSPSRTMSRLRRKSSSCSSRTAPTFRSAGRTARPPGRSRAPAGSIGWQSCRSTGCQGGDVMMES